MENKLKQLKQAVESLRMPGKELLSLHLFINTESDLDILRTSISAGLCPALRKTTRYLNSVSVVGLLVKRAPIDEATFRELIEAILENKEYCCSHLETLNFFGLNTGAEGVASLMKITPSLSSLKSLDLDRNAIGDKGCSLLCKNISVLSSLEYLFLSENNIGIAGMQSLICALPILKTLCGLGLDQNVFDRKTALHFLLTAAKQEVKWSTLGLGFSARSLVGDFAFLRSCQNENLADYLPVARSHPLHLVSSTDCVEQVRELIHSGTIDANAIDENGDPALFFAARAGLNEVIRVLVQEGGASLRIKNKRGMSVMEVANPIEHIGTRALLEEMIFTGADERPGQMIKSATKRFKPLVLDEDKYVDK